MDESGYRRYQEFFHSEPDEVVTWKDGETGAEGWLVMNSLRGGAAGGGTRMRAGATREEAVFLAKTMEIKFGVSGPLIGGAKSVLNFDRADRRKPEVLKRWFRHIGDHLKNRYGTGGDQNVHEDEVIALTREAIGLEHPQEGVLRAHYAPDNGGFQRILRQLQEGVQLPVRLPGVRKTFAMSTLVTGYGVAKAVEAYFDAAGGSVAGKRILVEGFGDVGGPSAYYLHKAGARVVGIISRPAGQKAFRWSVDPKGLDLDDLLARRVDTDLPGGVESEDPEPFWRTKADVFIPAASSFLITLERLDWLRGSGVKLIGCGANTPFDDRALGEVSVQKEADRSFVILPDFIANCGMARTFAYLMEEGAEVSEEAILADVERRMRSAVGKLLDGHTGEVGLLNRAFSLFVPAS
ncbi:MAG TPA: Glu/Leu/Phe/Val dehydrogenase dimerization domain-containing protein [Thermoanaerobaculia bacterium]|nr:Glu/Leu/Phe/Val dehydrogenase dimerization domain-containing protein [Thermoanaerobaculia bacterium]